MSDVTGVRGEIENLVQTAIVDGAQAVTIPVATLRSWVPRLRRKPPVQRPRAGSQPMDRQIAREIRRLNQEGLNHQQISAALDINTGRVSEVLTGEKWQE